MDRNLSAYKAQRAAKNAEFKRRLKPRLLWDSRRGSYIRAKHGPLPGHK